MKMSTYENMTKRSKFRALRLLKESIKTLFKHKVLQGYYSLLYKLNLICLHDIHYHGYVYGRCNEQPTPFDKIETDRGVFTTSYVTRIFRDHDEKWYMDKKKNKRLYVFEDYFQERIEITWRSEVESFTIKINPWTCYTVSRNTIQDITFAIPPKLTPIMSDDSFLYETNIKTKTLRLDYFNSRLGFSQALPYYMGEKQAIRATWENLKDFIEHNSANINYRLTGIHDDGNLVSSSGYTLTNNMLCPRCGAPVFETYTSGRPYFCINHDHLEEAFMECDPKRYESRRDYFKQDLLAYCDREI